MKWAGIKFTVSKIRLFNFSEFSNTLHCIVNSFVVLFWVYLIRSPSYFEKETIFFYFLFLLLGTINRDFVIFRVSIYSGFLQVRENPENPWFLNKIRISWNTVGIFIILIRMMRGFLCPLSSVSVVGISIFSPKIIIRKISYVKKDFELYQVFMDNFLC